MKRILIVALALTAVLLRNGAQSLLVAPPIASATVRSSRGGYGSWVNNQPTCRPSPLRGQDRDALDELRRSFVLSLLFGPVAFSSLPAVAKDLKEEYRQGTAALAEMDDQAPVPREAYKKLDSGVIYADLRRGSGTEQAGPGSRVNLQWVLRKSNGYFVDSSERNDSVPFIFNVGDGTAIQGLDEAVRGMSVGGVRRILIPPSLAYVQGLEDGKPGPLPVGFGPRQQMRRVQEVRKDVPGEYVYLEVQLTRMR